MLKLSSDLAARLGLAPARPSTPVMLRSAIALAAGAVLLTAAFGCGDLDAAPPEGAETENVLGQEVVATVPGAFREPRREAVAAASQLQSAALPPKELGSAVNGTTVTTQAPPSTPADVPVDTDANPTGLTEAEIAALAAAEDAENLPQDSQPVDSDAYALDLPPDADPPTPEAATDPADPPPSDAVDADPVDPEPPAEPADVPPSPLNDGREP